MTQTSVPQPAAAIGKRNLNSFYNTVPTTTQFLFANHMEDFTL